MADRSSRPHRSPRRTPAPVVRKIVHLRWKQRLGPVVIADRVGVAPSTAHAVLRRVRLNRLSHVDRATGEPIRRHEHQRPGQLLHVDVTDVAETDCELREDFEIARACFERDAAWLRRRNAEDDEDE